MSAVPAGLQVSFQPLSSCLAYPGSAIGANSVNSETIGVVNGSVVYISPNTLSSFIYL